MVQKPVAFNDRPRIRVSRSQIEAQHAATRPTHSGMIFHDGTVHSGGRTHYARPDSMDGVAVSKAARPLIFAQSSALKATNPLPHSARQLAPRIDKPSALQKPTGRRYIAPSGSGNVINPASDAPATSTPRRSTTPSAGGSPWRGVGRQAHTPRNNMEAGGTVRSDAEEPKLRGMRVQGHCPTFEAPAFQKRAYTPHKGRVSSKRPDTADLISFRPEGTPAVTPVRMRAQPAQRTYDLISGQAL